MSCRERGLTLVEVLVVAIVLVVGAALVVPALGQVARRDRVARCIGNLQALHRAQAAAPADGAKLGMEYWKRLPVAPETLRCPLVERPDAPACQYFGPRSDPASLNPLQPIGCDMETNHSPNMKQGGNVLLKSGEVSTEKGDGGLWLDARTKYCRP